MILYISSFIGSLIFIAIRLKIEKQKADDDPKYNIKWKKYFIKEWDDFGFSILIGQGLVFIQESLFFSYARWAEWDDKKAIDFYFDSEESIAFSMGLFGSVLIMLVFKFVIRKANKLTE